MSDILLVDDDATCRHKLCSLLAESEYSYLSVSEAGTGERGLSIFKQENPAIVIFDMSLPDMDGIEFGRKVLELQAGAFAVVLTHLKMFETVHQCINAGFSGYLLKPIHKTDFYPVMARLVQWSLTRSAKRLQSQSLRPEATQSVDFGNPIQSVISYVGEHFAEPISLHDVAERVYLSPSYFSRLFKAEMGITFVEYLTQVRIQKSKILLRVTSLPIELIASNTGFSNASYFATTFKRMEGRKPTEYRSLFTTLTTNPAE